jgi:hypothetical protein
VKKFQFLLKPDICEKWGRSPGATKEAITILSKHCPFELPSDYLDFLQFSNGADAGLPVDPLWCILFTAEEVLECNTDYEISEYLPGYFAIGSSGGGEILLFDTQTSPWRVCTVPVLFAEEHIHDVAPNFMEFLKLLGQPEQP